MDEPVSRIITIKPHFEYMLLSVIIPVYRVEATLNRCVKSVLAQNVDDMEVILVDDGSPDDCPRLCDEWAKKDSRIIVIHKDNGGLSDARNAALDVASGRYVTFVDSDDWLSDNTLEPLMNIIDNCDLLEYSIEGRLQLQDRVYKDIDEYWIRERAYTHTYACNKIYRKELFDGTRFPKGKVFEDAYTLPPLLRKCDKIRTSSHGYYHYTRNPHGITANADGEALRHLLEANLNNGMPVDDYYYMHMVNIQIDVWEHNGSDILLPKRNIKLNGLTGNMRIKAICLNTFGILFLCRMSKLLHIFKTPTRI